MAYENDHFIVHKFHEFEMPYRDSLYEREKLQFNVPSILCVDDGLCDEDDGETGLKK